MGCKATRSAHCNEIKTLFNYQDFNALKGDRKGQHAIRLSKAYRAIYIIGRQGNIEIAEIIEVNKHDY